MTDPVNHPKHYNVGRIETINYIDQICAHYPGDEASSIGNVFRYISRAPHKKNKLQDLHKAAWYLNHAIGRVEAKEGESTASNADGLEMPSEAAFNPPKHSGRKARK